MEHIITVLGTRPQFIKASAVSTALVDSEIKETIIHTGQHFDNNMSTIFWEELDLPEPDYHLQKNKKSAGGLISDIIDIIEHVESGVSTVLTYGDSDATVAGALAAHKSGLPIVHVEAGLRSHNPNMPEEMNRTVVDHLAHIHFCSSPLGVENLADEGITQHVHNVGDVMYDVLKSHINRATEEYPVSEFLPENRKKFYLLTLHRAQNTNNPARWKNIIKAAGQLDHTVLWPVHPRNKSLLENQELPDNLITIPPVSYLQMIALLNHAHRLLTDSGGLQKEAYWLKKPCITLRDETEWTETLRGNWNILAGTEIDSILEACRTSPDTPWKPLYGNGKAAQKIANVLNKR